MMIDIKKKVKDHVLLLKYYLQHSSLPDRYEYRRMGLYKVYEYAQLRNIARSITHVFGPPEISYRLDEAIVLCLVKNGGAWIDDFIRHYFKKGFKHIVLLDNGSTDNTVELAKKHGNITILNTEIPFKDNNILLRRYLVNRFGKARWSLTVDIDELWDYPHSDKVSLGEFLMYVKESGANAVVSQMLDMFKKELPRQQVPLSEYEYYDISCIEKQKIGVNGVFKEHGFTFKENLNNAIYLHTGGIRARLFGLKELWLTKMPLIFHDGTIQALTHQHFSNNAVIADVTTVMLHYKLTHKFKEQVNDAVRLEHYCSNSSEYKTYLTKLSSVDEIKSDKLKVEKLKSINQLIDSEFLLVSEPYLKFTGKIK